jgi:hypothetical protein
LPRFFVRTALALRILIIATFLPPVTTHDGIDLQYIRLIIAHQALYVDTTSWGWFWLHSAGAGVTALRTVLDELDTVSGQHQSGMLLRLNISETGSDWVLIHIHRQLEGRVRPMYEKEEEKIPLWRFRTSVSYLSVHVIHFPSTPVSYVRAQFLLPTGCVAYF